MADLQSVAPSFDTTSFANILPSLEKFSISCADLLTLASVEVSKRANVPARDVRGLTFALLQHLQEPLGSHDAIFDHARTSIMRPHMPNGIDAVSSWCAISTLDNGLDDILGGGFPAGYLSEITGESGAGKTQLLLTLLLSVQLPSPQGLAKSAIYISTEAPLQTNRLSQLLRCSPTFMARSDFERPSLSRVFSIHTPDLEAQDHILRYQVPVLIKRQNVGLIVIDSITANYRAEFEHWSQTPASSIPITAPNKLARHSVQIVKVGTLLRNLAHVENVAIVVANQVADRVDLDVHSTIITVPGGARSTPAPRSGSQSTKAFGSSISPGVFRDTLSLKHQQRWFTGWGEQYMNRGEDESLKTPSLGLAWANQIACRVVMLKGYGQNDNNSVLDYDSKARLYLRRRRVLKVAFAPWADARAAGYDNCPVGVEFEITEAGLQSVARPTRR